MERFTQAIRESVRSENWFSALFMSLAMPDICAQVESPSQRGDRTNGRKYKDWYNKYLRDKYVFDDTEGFLADSCWSFRCACLHRGMSAEERGLINEFAFRPPLNAPGLEVECAMYQHKGKLSIQIDIFAEDVCLAVERWRQDVAGRHDVEQRIKDLIHIDDAQNEGIVTYD